jgi:hypothetical protein
MCLLQSSLPARPACYPRGGGGRAGLGEYPLIRAGAPGPLNPSVGGGVVLGGALLMFHTTLAPRWGGDGREARVEHWTMSAHHESWLGTPRELAVVPIHGGGGNGPADVAGTWAEVVKEY